MNNCKHEVGEMLAHGAAVCGKCGARFQNPNWRGDGDVTDEGLLARAERALGGILDEVNPSDVNMSQEVLDLLWAVRIRLGMAEPEDRPIAS
jgi:hypothetical protein